MRSLQKITLLVATFGASLGFAADFKDPTWPCIQRKVPNLSIGQMWAGPPPPEGIELDEATTRLASAVAVRRTTLEEAETLIRQHAATLDKREDRNLHLATFFDAIFNQINRERSEVISGIARYAGKQTDLTLRIDELQQEQATLEEKGDDKTEDEWDRYEELVDVLLWDTRIYKERAQSLTFVCETPVILEKRLFALARSIMNELD